MLLFGFVLVSCLSLVTAHPYHGPPNKANADQSQKIDILRRLSVIDAAISTMDKDLVGLKNASSKPNPQVTEWLDQVRAMHAAVNGNNVQIAKLEGQLQAAINQTHNLAFLERILLLESGLRALNQTLINLQEAIEPPKPVSQFSYPYPTVNPPLTTAELEAHGWDLVFRGTACNGQNSYTAYTTGTGTTAFKPTDMARSTSSHYRLQNLNTVWPLLSPKYVKFALYQDGQEKAYIIFGALGSSFTDWFDKTKVLASSWARLTSTASYNYFSIPGFDVGYERRFYINEHHEGCDKDRGFFAAIERVAACNHDTHPCYPQFIYSAGDFADNWQRRQFGRADYMAVFIAK